MCKVFLKPFELCIKLSKLLSWKSYLDSIKFCINEEKFKCRYVIEKLP